MANKYEIKTMQDVIDCVTLSNIDNFMIDFRTYIESAISIKTIGEAICDAGNIDRAFSELKTDGFTWIDDGERNCSIEMRAK